MENWQEMRTVLLYWTAGLKNLAVQTKENLKCDKRWFLKLELWEIVTDEPYKKESIFTKGQLDVFYYVLPLHLFV